MAVMMDCPGCGKSKGAVPASEAFELCKDCKSGKTPEEIKEGKRARDEADLKVLELQHQEAQVLAETRKKIDKLKGKKEPLIRAATI